MTTNKNAYTKFVGATGSGLGEESLINQSSPSWIVTFVRWDIRDTFRTQDAGTITSTSVRNPLVVENDCIQVSTTISKSSLNASVTATFVQTNTNYETAVAPGDFMFVNMLDWDKDALRVAKQALAQSSINGPNDGFKGIFKVQSVRKILATNPENGTKMLLFKITGFSFTEFNNTIYFNPFLIDASQKNTILFINNIGTDWALRVNQKGTNTLQDIIKSLIDSFIGSGISDDGTVSTKVGSPVTANTHFYIPQLVGSLLGVNGAKAAKDIYNYLFGVQQYSSAQTQSLASGMNPTGLSNIDGRFWYTQQYCQGVQILKAEYWNQVKAWSILNQYTNSPLNELYTCFRISSTGSVMPTLVFRQIPFTTEDFSGTSIPVTKFMNIPRWKISPALVYTIDIGRDEAARINFMQYFGRSTINENGAEISAEIAQTNYVYDSDDVQRSGLRPYIVTVQFDEVIGSKTIYQSPNWAQIVGDSLIGGHLKMNGTIECIGISDPIAVGDNLDFDGVIYHIEQITHMCSISAGGDGRAIKTFRTTISVSSGVSKASSVSGTAYSEMLYPNAYAFRKNDFNNNKLLPGVSESQDVISRTLNPDLNDSGTNSSNDPFPQPQSTDSNPEDDTQD